MDVPLGMRHEAQNPACRVRQAGNVASRAIGIVAGMIAQGNLATVALSTQFKKTPESALDRVPLIQKQPQGEVVFDLANGRMHSANLRIEEELGASARFHGHAALGQ